jgi:hypothetical protein
VTLLPVGLVFHEPGSFRAGWAQLLVGDPLPTSDCIALYQTEPEAAVRRLTDRLADAIRRLIIEADNRQIFRLFEVAEAIWREEFTMSAPALAERTVWMRRATRAYRYLRTREPARIAALTDQVKRYVKDLELAHLKGRQLSQSYSPGVVWRYTLRDGLSLLLGLPLALWGIVNHLIPYQLTALTVRLLRPDPNAEATYKIGTAIVLFPLCWLIEGWSAWRLQGGWPLTLFVASLIPTGFFALTWRERFGRFVREARGFFQFLINRDLGRRLLERRQALMEELTALARGVPDSVLEGETVDS